MSLTPAQRAARDGRLTASFAPALMMGDDERLLNKWRELVGDPHHRELEVEDEWLVRVGSALEPVMLDWREFVTGRAMSRRGEVVVHPQHDWACATLDALDAEHPAGATVIECKALHRYRKLADAVPYHTWQALWQMDCLGIRRGMLYISDGGLEPKEYPVAYDEAASAELWRRAFAFMECVRTMSPPVAMPAIAAPVPPEKWREVDMAGSNEWAHYGFSWLTHRPAAKAFEEASKELKALVAPDVGRAFGYGIEVRRSRNGNLSIKESSA